MPLTLDTAWVCAACVPRLDVDISDGREPLHHVQSGGGATREHAWAAPGAARPRRRRAARARALWRACLAADTGGPGPGTDSSGRPVRARPHQCAGGGRAWRDGEKTRIRGA